jgi:hypothetical protein
MRGREGTGTNHGDNDDLESSSTAPGLISSRLEESEDEKDVGSGDQD